MMGKNGTFLEDNLDLHKVAPAESVVSKGNMAEKHETFLEDELADMMGAAGQHDIPGWLRLNHFHSAFVSWLGSSKW